MNLLKKYFETDAGLTHPSQSIKKISKAIYWIYLILGVLGLLYSIVGLFQEDEIWILFVGILFLLGGKLLGWLSSLGLRCFSIILESHEKHLYGTAPAEEIPAPAASIKPEIDAIQFTREKKKGEWQCTCGRINQSYISSCPCGKSKWEVLHPQTATEDQMDSDE